MLAGPYCILVKGGMPHKVRTLTVAGESLMPTELAAWNIQFSTLLPLLTYSFVMSSTPGPNNVLLATSGAHFGYRRTLPQLLGNITGVAALTFLACMGLGSLFATSPLLHQLLRMAGALYLLVLAYQLSRASLQPARNVQPMSFWQGVAFQAINPKSWVRAVTVATVFVPSHMALVPGTLLVCTVGFVVGFPSTSIWALFGTLIRHQLQEPFKQRLFNGFMAALLVVLAVSFLV